MSPATRTTWKHLPAPEAREPLFFEATFSEAEYQALGEGLIPRAMEDKWSIYLEDDWLHLHRSWTGAQIYAVRFERSAEGWRVADAWVNRNPDQYRGSDTAYDRELLRFIIDALLLHKPAVFPMPRGSEGKAPGAVQHHYVGRGNPEKPPEGSHR